MTLIRNGLIRAFVCCALFITAIAHAQDYGNGWISYSQYYFRIPIAREGVYRINSAALIQHPAIGNFNPAYYQVFFKGKELPLFVQGGSDGQIDPGDYVEFYCDPRPGDIDSLIYHQVNYVPNPYAGIFSDTLFAYFTVNSNAISKRFTIETDTATLAYPAAGYFYSERTRHFRIHYNPVSELLGGVSDPRYTQAEGWGLDFLKPNNWTTGAFTPLYAYQNPTLNAVFTIQYSGSSKSALIPFDHQVRVDYTDNSNNVVVLSDTVFSGYAPVRSVFDIPSTSLGSATEFTFTSVNSPSFASITNKTNLHFMRIFYPRVPNLGGYGEHRLYIDDHSGSSKQAFYFNNLNTGTVSAGVMYDVTNQRRLPLQVNGTNARVVVPNGGGRKFCYLASDQSVVQVNSLQPAGKDGKFTDFTAVGGPKPYVLIYHPQLIASAQAYRDYRQTMAGGGYQVVFADVKELYDQFSLGYPKHPLAIRNFALLLRDSLPTPPQAFLLFGRGQEIFSHHLTLVPTMGHPPCDNMIFAGPRFSTGSEFVTAFPVGRIATTTNAMAIDYLDKVKQHEATGQEPWKKTVLHFIGGNNDSEVAELSSYMSDYEQIIRDTLYGANVYTYKKTTNAPVQVNISDSIRRTINRGAGLLTFFGHGSTGGFDQAIDDPSLYANTGRYPFLLANSCLSGNIHASVITVSENFIFEKQKGSIGFLASTSLGFVHALRNYSSHFYRNFSSAMYNRPIGEIIRETARMNATAGDPITQFLSLDMTLHGDPVIRMSPGELPDYRTGNADVAFDLTNHLDSIGVIIYMHNAGKAVSDSILVQLVREFPNGDTSMIVQKIRGVLYADSLKIILPIDASRGFGLNGFYTMVDYQNNVQETNETNNSSGRVDLFVPGGDIAPVYPAKFAVIPKTTTITLKASTTDPFVAATPYRFELDTTDLFLTPLQATVITASGGVVQWRVELPYKDSTVYFWRVSRDSTSPNMRFYWRESSFQTIGEKRGWSQANFFQFKENRIQQLDYERTLRRFVFHKSTHQIRAHTGFHPFVVHQEQSYYFNNKKMDDWSCTFDGWNFAVFEPGSGEPQKVLSTTFPSKGKGQYGNCACKDNTEYYVYAYGAYQEFCDTTDWLTSMESFLNSLKPGSKVLAYTTAGGHAPYKTYVTSYSNSLYNAFESIGAKDIRNISDTVPYILIGRKGMSAGQAKVAIGTSRRSVLDLDDTVSTNWNRGVIESTTIGPAKNWQSLHWRVRDLESSGGDTTFLKIVGISIFGQLDTLATIPPDSVDILNLGTYVNASTHPYIRLVAFTRDNVHRTAPQLRRWQVLYEEAPECALNPPRGYTASNDSLQEGDEFTIVMPIENIAEKTFEDSLVVRYWVENAQREKVPLPDRLKKSGFAPGEVLFDTLQVKTVSLRGANALWMHVNPVNHLLYQTEQFQFNNIARIPFVVTTDRANPLLDVTFDGRRILHGDIVSAKPVVLVTLKDENKFLALNDTAAFTVSLRAPNSSSFTTLMFANGELEFTPAQLPKNSAKVLYRPPFLKDGRYTLQVRARDRSANLSGATDFTIDFEVNNQPSVTNVMNYPNPFTTSTRFVFTLTGSEVPEVFTIQIMTITGKIVREITRAELGTIHVGRNITEYAWDGRDQYGDRLGNGVYLYRVRTKLNGENIEHRQSGADQFFTKEFGKMVLMR